MVDAAPPGTRVICQKSVTLELTAPLSIQKPLTLQGLKARLPEGLGKTSLIVVDAEDVVLRDLELHGNYDSVDQKDRAPLIAVHQGQFRIETCAFYDSSKDGVAIYPRSGDGDIVGGMVRDIKAFRIGRDAVSISGGNQGQRVRQVRVENIRLKRGYLRGAVEVSDGTDHIHVSGVYAEACPYAVDVQDHRGQSAPNTHITIENVTAVDCQHILRTANSPRGHAHLTLRRLTGKRCQVPIKISNTRHVSIESLRVLAHTHREKPPIQIRNCQDVSITDTDITSLHFADKPLQAVDCVGLRLEIRKSRRNAP
jgi:hypothetical protein